MMISHDELFLLIFQMPSLKLRKGPFVFGPLFRCASPRGWWFRCSPSHPSWSCRSWCTKKRRLGKSDEDDDLGCTKPWKSWDIHHINWLAGFLPSTVCHHGSKCFCSRCWGNMFGTFFAKHRQTCKSKLYGVQSLVGCFVLEIIRSPVLQGDYPVIYYIHFYGSKV